MDPVQLVINVRAFEFWEIVVLSTLTGLGIAFVTWLLAGHYERRGGFGKK